MLNVRICLLAMLVMMFAMTTPLFADEPPPNLTDYIGVENCDPPTVDVTGTWVLKTRADSDCEGYPSNFEPFTITLYQTGSTFSLASPYENFTDGQICGNKAFWKGAYPDTGGVSDIYVFYFEIKEESNQMKGFDFWRWEHPDMYSCSGADYFTGHRID